MRFLLPDGVAGELALLVEDGGLGLDDRCLGLDERLGDAVPLLLVAPASALIFCEPKFNRNVVPPVPPLPLGDFGRGGDGGILK